MAMCSEAEKPQDKAADAKVACPRCFQRRPLWAETASASKNRDSDRADCPVCGWVGVADDMISAEFADYDKVEGYILETCRCLRAIKNVKYRVHCTINRAGGALILSIVNDALASMRPLCYFYCETLPISGGWRAIMEYIVERVWNSVHRLSGNEPMTPAECEQANYWLDNDSRTKRLEVSP